MIMARVGDRTETGGNMNTLKALATACAIGLLAAIQALAQQPAAPAAPVTAPPPPPYGAPISLEAAKKVMAAAEAEAMKNNWQQVIAILDSTGHLVMLHKMDNTQYGSLRVAEGKANTALEFRRPSKVFEDRLANVAGVGALSYGGVIMAEGGVPIAVEGKIVGAIGVSGALSPQDGQVAKAGADAAK
jgi:glc operon protein GlcG